MVLQTAPMGDDGGSGACGGVFCATKFSTALSLPWEALSLSIGEGHSA